tara:strand:- start:35643 stop:38192 length:2550 start_codon:yes stop_codon:yes gene_type:complete
LVFGKLGKKKSVTDKVGKASGDRGVAATELATYITAANLPDSPEVELVKKVTVGSEVGDLIIDDPSLSPRHCTFFINKNIVSLMDHSSSSGTFVNKRKIDPGKVFILNEKDKVKLGNVVLNIEQVEKEPEIEEIADSESDELNEEFEDSTREIPQFTPMSEMTASQKLEVDESIEEDVDEELPTQAQKIDLNSVALSSNDTVTKTLMRSKADDEFNFDGVDVEEEYLDADLLPEEIFEEHEQMFLQRKKGKGSKQADDDLEEELADLDKGGVFGKSKNPKVKSGNGKKGKKKVKKARGEPSSSFLTRVFALVNDGLLCLIILEIFYVYKDFATFYENFYLDLWAIIQPYYTQFVLPQYQNLLKEIPEVKNIVSSALELVDIQRALPFIIFVLLLRLLSGLCFSVSLGQIIIGMRATGPFIWKRIVYPIRELLGIVFFPFLIFDLPALFGKRTFKEIILFSQYKTPRKGFTVVSALLFTPLLVIAFGMAPLVKGLDVNDPVLVSNNESPIISVKFDNAVYIQSLDMTLNLNDDFAYLPVFEINTVKNKKILKTGVLVVALEQNGLIDFIKLKTFNLNDFYKDFVRNNILSEYFQPTMHAHVKGMALESNKDFKKSKPAYSQLGEESKQVLLDIFEFKMEDIVKFALKNGLVMSGFRDFREKFESLFDKNIKGLEGIDIGQHKGVMVELNAGRVSEYNYVVLGKEVGTIYKTTANFGRKNIIELRNEVYFGKKEGVLKTLSSAEAPIAKFINDFNSNKFQAAPEVYQGIYDNYKMVLTNYLRNFRLTKGLESHLQQFVNILEYINENDQTNSLKKEILSFSEMLQALKDKDYGFFNIQDPAATLDNNEQTP